jgi:ubiquinone/menaquinone biosynthesis C-methylase UbiE
MAGFDRVAGLYDCLAHLVYGKTLLKAKSHLLSQIRESDRVLIIGGGTGEILPMLPSSCQVTFLDPSTKMIEVAVKRGKPIETTFVCQILDDFENRGKFDVIICNFFFDLFEEPELFEQIEKVKILLEPKGKFIVTDFSYGSPLNQVWQRPLVASMYLFFRFTDGLKTNGLPKIEKKLEGAGLYVQTEKRFGKGFIWSGVYRREKDNFK